MGSKAAQVQASAVKARRECVKPAVNDHAVVTLVTSNEGYPAGALAVAASLAVQDSALRRICLVTGAVAPGIRELLGNASWEVREVDEVRCNQMMGPAMTADRYDMGPEYQAKKAKWLSTCTKFHLWGLTFLKKLIYLDAVTSCNGM